jgi:glycosyltransferase involved in cell wall biosynthesis
MRACAIIPAYDAEGSVVEVIRAVHALWPERYAVFVVDDGSRDRTADVAREAGARVIVLPRNCGKGAALRAGMAEALAAGFDVAVTLDADGQHPADEARRLLDVSPDPEALVLGIRDLAGAGAPRKNRFSNGISNFFLSLFARRRLLDTQCGLRRYPLARTLDLDGEDPGYAYEAEIILRALAAGVAVVEAPVRVLYPPEGERVTHFDSVRDPARIIRRVVDTLVVTRGVRRAPAPRAAPAPDAAPASRASLAAKASPSTSRNPRPATSAPHAASAPVGEGHPGVSAP